MARDKRAKATGKAGNGRFLAGPEPQAIYCDPKLAGSFSPLTCLIAGHLVYWLSHHSKRWERRQDFAELFLVSDATVKRQRPHLEQIFKITRTTMTKGTQKIPGANQYALRPEYSYLRWGSPAPGAGRIAPGSNMAAFPISFLGLPLKMMEKPNIDLAWFLCGLSRVMHINRLKAASFKNWKALESWTQTPPRTAKRYLSQAADAGLITFYDEHRPALAMTESGISLLLNPFLELAEEHHKARTTARLNGMIEDLAGHEGSGADAKVDWYDSLCREELGYGLLEFHARAEGAIDERGELDTDWAYDNLAGF